MKIRRALAVLTTGAALVGVGATTAQGDGTAADGPGRAAATDMNTRALGVSITADGGEVVWAGRCPVATAEQDVGAIDATCRGLGYLGNAGVVRTMRRLGGTVVTDRVDGDLRGTVALTTSTLTRTIYPGVASPGLTGVFIESCRLDADGVLTQECRRSTGLTRRAARRTVRAGR